MTTATIVSIVFLTLLAAGVGAVQVVNALMRRRWREHEHYPFLVDELRFERWQDRFLIDTRIQRYVGKLNGQEIQIEVGSGAHGIYVRVDLDFSEPVDLGIRVSSEHEDGLMTRVMRLHEVEMGHGSFDSQFILLTRDEQRLTDLLDSDMRRALVALGGRVSDLRLNDYGLHLQLLEEVDPTVLVEVLERAAMLMTDMFYRAKQNKEERQQATQANFTAVTGTMSSIEETRQ